MPDWISTLLDLLAQFTGGRPPDGPPIAWYGIAAAGWTILLIVELYRQKRHKSPREALLVWAFAFGLGREAVMIGLKGAVAFGLLDDVSAHVLYPPLEHMLQNIAMVVIAAAFARFVTEKADFSNAYLRIGIGLMVSSYLATFWWWAAFIRANPNAKFGHTWCDWVFHSIMSALLFVAIVSLLKSPRSRIRNWSCAALALFFIFEFLKLPDIATHEIHSTIYSPLRHGCYLLAIPMLGMVYIRELIAEMDSTVATLDSSVAEKTRELTNALAELEGELAERKRIERELIDTRDTALAATRMKSEFLANMSHEIRTPMNGVIGMANLLLEGELASDQAKFARVIAQSGDSLLAIIDDILDMSRIEAGKLELDAREFDIRNIVDGAVVALAYTAQVKGVEIASLIDSDTPETVIGDPTRLRQILSNLIGNAIKFTDHGDILVRVSVASQSNEDARLHFAVTDSGIGISKDAQEQIFGAFVQAQKSNNRSYGGAGLGLAICQDLVKLMGGKIEVQSAPNKGSMFSFSANFAAVPSQTIATRKQPEQFRRALVVEPNRMLREILDHYLNEAGYSPRFSFDEQDVIEAITEADFADKPFDLIFVDQDPTSFEKTSLSKIIHRYCATIGSRLVQILSSIDRPDPTERQDDVAYLMKPFSRGELFEVISDEWNRPYAPDLDDTDSETAAGADSGISDADARILLVDDNRTNRFVTQSQLRSLGFESDLACDGREAINAVRNRDYDVILMDCQMPRIDGFAATRAIRALMRQRHSDEAASSKPHIIAMTANALPGAREECLKSGMNDYVSKPIQKHELVSVLAQAIPSLNGKPQPAKSKAAPIDSSTTSRMPLVKHLESEGLFGEIGQIEDLTRLYLEDAHEMVSKMRESIDSSNRTNLRSAAHGLAGASAVLQLTTISSLSKRMEKLEIDAPIEDPKNLLSRIEKEVRRLSGQPV